jgi:heptosyltransferase II
VTTASHGSRPIRPDPLRPDLRSLVVAPQWIGDAVMSEPLMRRLAERGESITVGALPWVAPVYRAMAAVAEVEEWPFAHGRLDARERLAVASRLRSRFDRAYVLPNSLKAALIPWLAGVPLRIGYRGEGRVGLLNRRLANPPGRPPMVGFYAALADLAEPAATADVAGPLADATRPRLRLAGSALEQAAAFAGVAPGHYRVFAPGAEYGPAKCWPPGHYAELASSLIARDGQPVLLLGSSREAGLCRAIVDAVAPAHRADCRVLAGRTDLSQAMALIANARSVVSNDSGLMHIAAAFGVEQVALFGSTSPEHTPPLNPRARVVWIKDELALDCAPCFDRQCRFGHTRCLTEITPARVAALLGDAPEAARRPS